MWSVLFDTETTGLDPLRPIEGGSAWGAPPVASSAMPVMRRMTWAAMLFAVGYGLSIGMNTIARGAVPLALFGPKGYGARLGKLAAPSFVAEAAAPIVYAAAIGQWGVWGGLSSAACAGLLAWFGVLALTMLYRGESDQG